MQEINPSEEEFDSQYEDEFDDKDDKEEINWATQHRNRNYRKRSWSDDDDDKEV